MKQYTSFVVPVPEFSGLLMDHNVTYRGISHLFHFMSCRGMDYTGTTSHTFARPIHTRQAFLETCKPPKLRPPMAVADLPARGLNWPRAHMAPLHSIASTTSGHH